MGEYYSCPRISSEYPDCSLPLTADTTSLCTFKCQYCFAAYQKLNNPSLKDIGNFRTKPLNFEYFEKMMRGQVPDNPYYKNFIKYRFPIHFGGLSDAFDHYERENGITLKILKLLAELKYPTIFSTKGILMAEGEYYEILKKSAENKNFIFQFSIITNNQKKADKLEMCVPSVDDRFKAMRKISDLGYWTVLRLRPFIIGASDDGLDELFKKASESGVRALSTEFYCLDVKLGCNHEMYKNVSDVVGFDVIEFFKKLSPSERGGYRRLNRDVKEKYVKRMWLLCKKYNLQFNVSDPDFKELNQSGSCCGIPDSRETYDSECVNWSRGQLTNILHNFMRRHLAGEKDLILKIDDVFRLIPNRWNEEHDYWGDSLKSFGGKIQNKEMNFEYEFRHTWNNTRSSANPYNYFHGLLKPIGLDENKNIIYKFNPPEYIERWRKEGIL